tara:strand:- start:263 stop:535 length:273 start_codon:yes stop_codon:yes gene_type:complete
MATDLYYSSEFQKISFGDKGLRVLAVGATSVAGENFCAIQAIESSTISCDIDTNGGDTSITSLSIGAGVIIYGNFDDISVASGKIVAYLR